MGAEICSAMFGDNGVTGLETGSLHATEVWMPLSDATGDCMKSNEVDANVSID
jgi:hypothetical protein